MVYEMWPTGKIVSKSTHMDRFIRLKLYLKIFNAFKSLCCFIRANATKYIYFDKKIYN